MSTNCAPIIAHIRRLQGQMNALSAAIEDGKSCRDIAHLVRSVCASCDAVRGRIAVEYVREAMENSVSPDSEDWQALQSLLIH